MDQGGGGDEADGEALLTGGQPQAQRDMGFARAARPEGDDVLPPVDPFAITLKSKLSRLLTAGNLAALIRRSIIRRSRSISSSSTSRARN